MADEPPFLHKQKRFGVFLQHFLVNFQVLEGLGLQPLPNYLFFLHEHSLFKMAFCSRYIYGSMHIYLVVNYRI